MTEAEDHRLSVVGTGTLAGKRLTDVFNRHAQPDIDAMGRKKNGREDYEKKFYVILDELAEIDKKLGVRDA